MAKAGIPLLVLAPCLEGKGRTLVYHIKPCALVGSKLNADVLFACILERRKREVSHINAH